MVTMLKNKCSVWKRIRFPTFWYNCYYFTWSDTYFIQLETLLINHPSYVTELLAAFHRMECAPLATFCFYYCVFRNNVRGLNINRHSPWNDLTFLCLSIGCYCWPNDRFSRPWMWLHWFVINTSINRNTVTPLPPFVYAVYHCLIVAFQFYSV